MGLTEDDQALAVRGYVIAHTGVLPTDPRFQALSANEELLAFTAHWLQKRETDFFEHLGKILGVRWERSEAEAMFGQKKQSSKIPNETFIPLAAAINPQLIDTLKNIFRITKGGPFIGGGEYMSKVGEEVVELGDLPPEEFLQFINSATPVMKETAERLEKQQRLVNVREGSDQHEDERLQRIREQITHSKRFK